MIQARGSLVPTKVRACLLVFVVACGSPQPAAPATAPAGRTPDGTGVRVDVTGERIARVDQLRGQLRGPTEATWLWPPIIDSHVHLAIWPVANELARTGVAAVVDLAAPERALSTRAPIRVIAAGPMLTSPDGYPLDSWGSDGYGIGCADEASVRAAIDRLAAAGTRVVKLAVDDNGLDPALVPIAIDVAHAKQMKVAVHALSNASAARAAAADADILAHTPVEPLSDDTIQRWRGKAVISTLAAFGGSDAAIENLRRLRAGGVTVLYGTDLGNLRDAGPSAAELQLLARAGLDDAAIVDSMTTAPAKFWGLPFGITVGSEASFLVLDRDPRRNAATLLAPREVWLRGRRM